MDKQGKKALVPRLRFPEFREAPAWKEEKLGGLVDTVNPPKKLPSSSYLKVGKFPIIDQSQASICGWTDDAQAVIKEPLPVIVFGDHTCALKFVDRPFAQGADGIKILVAKPAVSIEYLFHSLNHYPLVMEDYKRHFSTLKERKVFFPSIESGEQQKIADCLTSLDEVVAAENQKLDTLKTYKKGLMQQLFPREGETVPRLRFPEFLETAAWEEEKLEKLVDTASPPKKLPSSSYLKVGKFPIIDQSQASICGWTDDEQAVIKDPLPVIVFGDHTCALKFVDRPFAQGADGIKILVAKPVILIEYLFHSLNHYPLEMEDYKRHFSMLKERKVFFPSIESGEQQKIADCLSFLDEIITAQSQKIDALKIHKKGLMQQLFPVLDEVPA